MARLGGADEFLQLVCVNTDRGPEKPPGPEGRDTLEEREAVTQAANGFRHGFGQWKERLAKVVSTYRQRGRHVAVWGTGSRGVALLSGLGLPGDSYAYAVDSDSNKHGRYLPMIRRPIYPPEQLRREPVDCILVTSYTYFDEILAKLDWFRSQGGEILRVYPTPEVV